MIDLDKEKYYVNAYLVTREFGGHEEGGWYYDNWKRLDYAEFSDELKAEKCLLDMKEKHKDKNFGDISSVMGGQKVLVYIEDKQYKNETTEKPVYE